MKIRKADIKQDYNAVWEIFRKVIAGGDTYVFLPDTPKTDLAKYWFDSGMDTFVVESEDGTIIGTYIIKPNFIGRGSHIANCSYMVHPDYRGQGIGELMGNHSISYAGLKGYRAIQFNLVVSSNQPAVRLWQKLGFDIIATVPEAFNHPKLGYVDCYIMYLSLKDLNK